MWRYCSAQMAVAKYSDHYVPFAIFCKRGDAPLDTPFGTERSAPRYHEACAAFVYVCKTARLPLCQINADHAACVPLIERYLNMDGWTYRE